MVPPVEMILVEAMEEASVVTTCARERGMETLPKENMGWPQARILPWSTVVTVQPGEIERSPRINSTPTMSPGFSCASSGEGAAVPPPSWTCLPQAESCLLNSAMVSG